MVLDDVAGIEPVDLVLELVGAKHLSLALGVLAPFARIVTIGVSSGGARMEVDLHVLMSKRATLTGSTLRSRSREEKADVIKRVNETLLPLWTSADLQVPIARSFALDDAAQASSFLRNRASSARSSCASTNESPSSDVKDPAPIERPHPSRCSPTRNDYEAIIKAHEAAVTLGEPSYRDPTTGLFVLTGGDASGTWHVLRQRLSPLPLRRKLDLQQRT